MNNYELLGAIGQGQYGTAYKARHKLEDRLYCLKRITMTAKDDRQQALREAQLLSSLNHPNIIGYKESFLDQTDALCIVTTFCEEGDLFNKIRKRATQKQYFTENEIMDMFIQTASSLMYIHDKKILHRDLKTQNIFIARGNIVQLGDFGISKVLEKTDQFATTVTGTPYYMAPEICTNQPYTFKSDIWSLGCVLYELCTLKHAFAADSLLSLVYQIVRGNFPPIPTDTFSKGMSDLVNSLLVREQTQRPSLRQVFQMPYVQQHLQRYKNDERRRSLRSTANGQTRTLEQPSAAVRGGIAFPPSVGDDDPNLTPKQKLERKKELERRRRELELQVASINNQKDKAIAQQRKQANLYESNVNIGSAQKYAGNGSRPNSGLDKNSDPLNLTAIEQALLDEPPPSTSAKKPVNNNPWDLGTTKPAAMSQRGAVVKPAGNMGYGTGLDDSLVMMGTMPGMQTADKSSRPISASDNRQSPNMYLPQPAFPRTPQYGAGGSGNAGYDDDDVLLGSVRQTGALTTSNRPLSASNLPAAAAPTPKWANPAANVLLSQPQPSGRTTLAPITPPLGMARPQNNAAPAAASERRNMLGVGPAARGGGAGPLARQHHDEDDYEDDFEEMYEDDDFEEYDPSEEVQHHRQIVKELEKSMSMSDDTAEQVIAGVQERVATGTKNSKTLALKKQCEAQLGSVLPQVYAYLKKVRTSNVSTDEKEVQKKLLELVSGDRTRLQGCFMVDQLVFQEMMYR